jgi:SAM-dependent methyltransferase
VSETSRLAAVEPKPDHLGPEYGEQFGDASVVAAYHHRPPYPVEVFDILIGLMSGESGAVLDVGTGTGEIARGLAPRVARIDAVEPSPGMIATGRAMPGGDHPNLTWIEGSAEDAPLQPPYGLITAGQSLHWMEWAVVMPRFRGALAAGGVLAIVGQGEQPQPWDAAVLDAIRRYTTNLRYRSYDLIDELESRGLFRTLGRRSTAPLPFVRDVAGYVESFHARNGLSRDRMTLDAAAAFDRAVTELVVPFARDGQLALAVTGEVIWGLPAPTVL